MTTFFIVGLVGAALLLVTVVVDDIFEGLFDSLEFGDGFVSGPAVGGFLTAFGFGGAFASGAGLSVAAAAGVGVVAGVAVGGLAGVVTRSLMRMPTDATPTDADLVGLEGSVVTPIGADGVGEVSVNVGGQPVKLSARSSAGVSIAAGAPVRVVAALSPTAVTVEHAG